MFATVLAVAVASAGLVAPAPTYSPPLERPVERGFDVSRGPYGAGNRGLDFAVRPGDVVAAIGDGAVVFAGPVAGATWVTVLHPDGLRSTSGPMATVDVVPGAGVRRGDRLGTTGATFHLGVRRGSVYVDPATLFRVRRRHARLVPVRSAKSSARVVEIHDPRRRFRGGGARATTLVTRQRQVGAPVGTAPWPPSSIHPRGETPVAQLSASPRSPTEGNPHSWPQSSP